ncbi:MAG: hypothetical protein E6Q97_29385 [Desulfurellales bacterium]|nr:MAG: hypothetical protein E6Q97_29385 [Desulfurellales bacterium]
MSYRAIEVHEYECDLCGTKSTDYADVVPFGWVEIKDIMADEEKHVCKVCAISFFKKAGAMFGFSKRPDAGVESHYPTRQADPSA